LAKEGQSLNTLKKEFTSVSVTDQEIDEYQQQYELDEFEELEINLYDNIQRNGTYKHYLQRFIDSARKGND